MSKTCLHHLDFLYLFKQKVNVIESLMELMQNLLFEITVPTYRKVNKPIKAFYSSFILPSNMVIFKLMVHYYRTLMESKTAVKMQI